MAIHTIHSNGIERCAGYGQWGFLGMSFAIITSTSMVAALLMRFVCREAAGSGIPQLKIAFWQRFGVQPVRMFVVKFLAGALTIGGGSSLGREGPTVQIGSGLASSLAPLMGVAKQNRRVGAAAGAAAGLAAAFNAPLTAITFVLEEIIEDMNSRLLGSVILASVLGAIVTHAMFGEEPAFQMAQIRTHSWIVYAFVPLVAAAAALCGVAFYHLTLRIRSRTASWKKMPVWLQPVVGGWITWMLGACVFLVTGKLGVFGMGYHDLTDALNNNLAWQVAGVLVVAKLLATAFSYGTGGCGGIFAPTLFLGGMASVFLTGVIGQFHVLSENDRMLLAVVGLSACLGAVVRAPITSILIVFEMTRQFSLVPALLIGTLVSQWIARTLTRSNFYEAVLHQDGHDLRKVVPPRDLHGYRQLPVSAIAAFKPVVAESLEPGLLRQLLESTKFRRYPVVIDGKLQGILSREEAERTVDGGGEPELERARTCQRDDTIAEVQSMIIESQNGVVVIMDSKEDGLPIGLLTLHDLLRAEAEMGKRMSGA